MESSWSEFKCRSGDRGDIGSLDREFESRNRSTAKTVRDIFLEPRYTSPRDLSERQQKSVDMS
jgi:hypothetical protein